MADLLALLSQAGSSLGAHRNASATASHNIQNVNTPGYSRQRAELEAVTPAEMTAGIFIGRGVALAAVSQSRDRFLEAQMPGALAQSSRSQTQADTLSAVSVLNTHDGTGLTDALGNMYSAFRALTQNPGSAALRQGVVSSVQAFVTSVNRTAQGLAAARTGVDTKLAGSVSEVNALAAQMASLNKDIAVELASGGQPNDLLDARQRAQDRLVELTGASPITNGNGTVSLALSNGVALVSADRAASFSTLPDATNRGHVSVQVTQVDGSGPFAVSSTALGGEMGGLLDSRDGALRSAETQVDQLAFDLAGTLNTVHQAGFALDGSTGHNLFTVGSTAAGAATSLTVDASVLANPSLFSAAASSGTVPGDGTQLLALIATETKALSSGSDASGTLASIVTQFGVASQAATVSAEHDSAMLSQLSMMRESASGVSIDEELLNLTRAEKAYNAVAKVLKTTNDMLDTLMAIK